MWFLTSVNVDDKPTEMFLWKDGVRFAVKNASGNMEGCGPVQAVCCVGDSDKDVIKVSVSFLGKTPHGGIVVPFERRAYSVYVFTVLRCARLTQNCMTFNTLRCRN